MKTLQFLSILSILFLTGCTNPVRLKYDIPDNAESSISEIIVTNVENSTSSITSMDTENPTVYVYATVTNCIDAAIDIEWFYGIDTLIQEETVLITQETQTLLISITSPNGGWPLGEYSVDFYKDDVFVDSIDYTITEETPQSNPSWLVGAYYYEYADGDIPQNIVSQEVVLNADGTWTSHHLWSSKVMSSTVEGTDDGTWSYVDGDVILYTERGYTLTYQVIGHRLAGVDHYWLDVTMYFSKPWTE